MPRLSATSFSRGLATGFGLGMRVRGARRHRGIARRLASLLEFLVLSLQRQNGLIERRDRRLQFAIAPEQLLHESHDDTPDVLTLRRLPQNQLLIEPYQFDGCLNLRRVHTGDIATRSIPAQTSSRPVNGYQPHPTRFREEPQFPQLGDALNDLLESQP